MINRTGCGYVDLPPALAERRSKTAKIQVSITVNCPPGMEKKYKKFVEGLEEESIKAFRKYTNKMIKKAENTDE